MITKEVPSAVDPGPEEARLLERLLDRVSAIGVRDPRVLSAMRAMPRHAFVPDVDLEEA